MEQAEKLMPGGVNSPVRAFKSVEHTPAILWIMVKDLKYMILMEMNTLIMCWLGPINSGT